MLKKAPLSIVCIGAVWQRLLMAHGWQVACGSYGTMKV